MRLPGTGVGVARLVAVSMVKVDISRGLSRLCREAQNDSLGKLQVQRQCNGSTLK
jgi:hypothetical protein